MAELVKHENNQAVFTFSVAWSQFEKAIGVAYNNNKAKFKIPGFRAGKVPRSLIEKHYGEGVFYEDAINEVLPEAYDRAVEELALEPVDRPDIDIVELEKGEDLVIEATVATKPDVELGDYQGVEVEVAKAQVSDEQIDQALSAEQEKNARMVPVEDRAAQMNDTVLIDYKGSIDGEYFEGGTAEKHELELGTKQFIGDFEEQLVGMSPNDKKEVNVQFPDDYHAEDLAGKMAKFEVVLHEIKQKDLPQIDDEFIKDISEFDTVDEYRKQKRSELEQMNEESYNNQVRAAVVEKVVDNALVDIPEAMIEQQIDQMVNDFSYQLMYQGLDLDTYLQYTKSTKQELRDNMKGDAEPRVKTSLVIEAIAEKEAIAPSDDDVEAELAEIAKSQDKAVEDIRQVYARDDYGMIRDHLKSKATVDFLVDSAIVK